MRMTMAYSLKYKKKKIQEMEVSMRIIHLMCEVWLSLLMQTKYL